MDEERVSELKPDFKKILKMQHKKDKKIENRKRKEEWEGLTYIQSYTRENRTRTRTCWKRRAKKMAELMKDMNPQRQKYDISQAG